MAAVELLQTHDLTKRFGGLLAVEGVDFSLPQGQIRALIGPNGAGKSTLVGLISGRIPATAGSVSFQSRDITRLPAHKRIAAGMAYTFQITSVYERLTLNENVALAVRRVSPGSEADVDSQVADALNHVGLEDRRHEVAGDLSYGHQRLLEIAMGLAQKPKLLILDEPTQGLADSEIANFKNLIRSMAGSTTILLIEHNMDVVMDTADFVTVLNFGNILAEGTPDEVSANHDVQAAYLGTADA
ncbi:MAG: ABC transporter ATP-binding protein [Rhizobiaceae bacterium]